MGPADRIVLVVDDDAVILRLVEAMLRRGGYSTISASSGAQAVDRAAQFRAHIHLLLTDVVMPEMDGLTLAKEILSRRPETRILLMSAYAHAPSRLPLVMKPFRAEQLLDEVASAIAGPPAVPSDVVAGDFYAIDPVQGALTAELDEARRRYIECSREFLAITQDVPSGIPNPDGILRVQLSAAARRRAYEDYQRARERLDEHTAAEQRRRESPANE